MPYTLRDEFVQEKIHRCGSADAHSNPHRNDNFAGRLRKTAALRPPRPGNAGPFDAASRGGGTKPPSACGFAVLASARAAHSAARSAIRGGPPGSDCCAWPFELLRHSIPASLPQRNDANRRPRSGDGRETNGFPLSFGGKATLTNPSLMCCLRRI